MEQQVLLRTREMQLVEARFGKPIAEVLEELYLERRLTVEQVGAELGITKGAVSRWLERCRIPARRPGRKAS